MINRFSHVSDLKLSCKTDACGPGICIPQVDGYWCDCNTTGRIGTPCTGGEYIVNLCYYRPINIKTCPTLRPPNIDP